MEDLSVDQVATRQDVQERLALLADSKPSKTGPLTLLIGGGALALASPLISYFSASFLGLSGPTLLLMFWTGVGIGVAAAVAGAIWLVVTLSTRHRIEGEMKGLQQQLQREVAPAPPPMPPSVSSPAPEAHWHIAAF